MDKDKRVVTASLPAQLVEQMEKVADRLDRTKNWIIREALTEWMADEHRRYELTLQALDDVDQGRTLSHEEAVASLKRRQQQPS